MCCGDAAAAVGDTYFNVNLSSEIKWWKNRNVSQKTLNWSINLNRLSINLIGLISCRGDSYIEKLINTTSTYRTISILEVLIQDTHFQHFNARLFWSWYKTWEVKVIVLGILKVQEAKFVMHLLNVPFHSLTLCYHKKWFMWQCFNYTKLIELD